MEAAAKLEEEKKQKLRIAEVERREKHEANLLKISERSKREPELARGRDERKHQHSHEKAPELPELSAIATQA